MQKLTWKRTEWVCSSNWSGSTSAKMTFTFAYVSSPLPVYPMINSTWTRSRTKGNKMVWHICSSEGKKEVKEQKKLQALTSFTTLRQEPLCSRGTGQSDWAVTLIWNKIYKSHCFFPSLIFFSLTNLIDLYRWLCWSERNFCCLSPETYQKIWHLPQLNNWNLLQNKRYMLDSLLCDI